MVKWYCSGANWRMLDRSKSASERGTNITSFMFSFCNLRAPCYKEFELALQVFLERNCHICDILHPLEIEKYVME